METPVTGHEKFQGRLSIPYLTPSGTVAMNFRAIHPVPKGKYIAEEGQYRPLYNVNVLQHGYDKIYIAEGELTAAMATQLGYPCVGVPGVEKWEEWWSYLFDGYNDVVVLMDGDEEKTVDLPKGGKRTFIPSETLWTNVSRSVRQSRPVRFPIPDDLDSYYLKYGVEPLASLIES